MVATALGGEAETRRGGLGGCLGSSGDTWEDRGQEDHHSLRAGGPESGDTCVLSPYSPVKWASSSPSYRSGMEAQRGRGTCPGSHSRHAHSRNKNQLA